MKSLVRPYEPGAAEEIIIPLGDLQDDENGHFRSIQTAEREYLRFSPIVQDRTKRACGMRTSAAPTSPGTAFSSNPNWMQHAAMLQ